MPAFVICRLCAVVSKIIHETDATLAGLAKLLALEWRFVVRLIHQSDLRFDELHDAVGTLTPPLVDCR